MRDLYEILGVARDADAETIKRAYRRKARELHPDAGGDEESFKELTAAYEILSNERARANYDRYGDPRGPAGAEGFEGFSGFGDLQDFIEAFFGGFGGASRRQSARAAARGGRDALVDVRLTLDEAFTGVRHDVELTLPRLCEACEGSGAAPGGGPVRCEECGGAGAVQQVARSVFGQVLTTGTCPSCEGLGTRVLEPCPSCDGQGRREVTETITVDIPPGVDDGTRLRLTGRGESGRLGGQSGDLYVRVRLAQHPIFTRDGEDLHCELRLPMSQAALGAELRVPTLAGEQPVQVPAGVQNGEVIALKGHGMPRLGQPRTRGRLHIHVRVITPTDLTPEQEEVLRRFAALRNEEVREEGKRFFGRLREAFGA
ncbi:MAG TPA: J domain-containing protein [Egibacteraceae bacterium]|nr:J domain-containing protein [Egibacteraceae bacterium]